MQFPSIRKTWFQYRPSKPGGFFDVLENTMLPHPEIDEQDPDKPVSSWSTSSLRKVLEWQASVRDVEFTLVVGLDFIPLHASPFPVSSIQHVVDWTSCFRSITFATRLEHIFASLPGFGSCCIWNWCWRCGSEAGVRMSRRPPPGTHYSESASNSFCGTVCRHGRGSVCRAILSSGTWYMVCDQVGVFHVR